MRIIDGILGEYEHECATTRKLLELVPEADFGWKPHEKSMSLGVLAGHLAENPGWTEVTLKQDGMDMNPDEYRPFTPKTKKELLEAFDQNVAKAKAVMAETSNEELLKPWTMKVRGKVHMSMPKIAVLRGFIMNHTVHHRGQLTVYLRMRNVKLPSVYGPTADAPM
ncbi:MAG: DinB family protein [Planctomycetota bacterium]|nr:DinB family protein [Planctomycetota bacterium]